jgi:hypothetical protein
MPHWLRPLTAVVPIMPEAMRSGKLQAETANQRFSAKRNA